MPRSLEYPHRIIKEKVAGDDEFVAKDSKYKLRVETQFLDKRPLIAVTTNEKMDHLEQFSLITGERSKKLFEAVLLGKYVVSYYTCPSTGFIQTEPPYWMKEAYSSAITALDLGIITRNFEKARLTEHVIRAMETDNASYLDYGGGYGIFTRLMRDRGFDFKHYDLHCENLFSRCFEAKELSESPGRYAIVTAWEVMEHLPDPLSVVSEVLSVSDSFLFSTELIPDKELNSIADWWYFTPETGQHISLYTRKSLEVIAKRWDANLYTDGLCNHLITKAGLKRDPFQTYRKSAMRRIVDKLFRSEEHQNQRKSLLPSDFDAALASLRADQALKGTQSR